MKQDMINLGINENKIHVTGIPMSDRFLRTLINQKYMKCLN